MINYKSAFFLTTYDYDPEAVWLTGGNNLEDGEQEQLCGSKVPIRGEKEQL